MRLLGDDATTIRDVVIDPFAGYKAAVRDLAPDARRTADRFHIVKLANQAVTDVRCRCQHEVTGHRGRSDDPFYRARRDLLRARERLTDHGWARLHATFDGCASSTAAHDTLSPPGLRAPAARSSAENR